MKSWPTKPLGDVAEFINGRAFKPSEWSAKGVPIIRIQNLTDPTASANKFEGTFIERYAVRNGDLLVSWSATLDVFVWNRGEAVLNQHIFHVIPDSSKVSKTYLFYALKSVMNELRSKTHGATMKHITKGPFERTMIPVPPLAEQDRIVKLLDEADGLRKFRAQADRRIADLIPALFHKMFGDPIKNPKGWEVCTLAEVGKLDRGRSKNRPRDEPSLYSGKYPFIQTGDVANSNGEIIAYTQTYSEKGLAQSRMWPAGTLVITIAANIGKTAILTFPACFPDSMVGFVPGDRVIVDYVRPWLVTMESRLDEAAPQMAQKNINLKILSELTIPVPPLALQKEFAERVTEIRALETAQTTSRTRLDALFQSMLHRAFNGEL